MKNYLYIQVIALLLCFLPTAHGALSPVAISILPPLQFPPEDFSVTGVRASVLWGRHRDVYGIDLGLIGNQTKQDFVGTGIAGGFNWTQGNTTILGLQLAAVANINTQKTNVYGIQAAALNWNEATSSTVGLAIALANISPHTDVYGVQVGVYNKAAKVYGFQIGLVNVTESLRGLQIGLINFHQKGLFVVSPIINFGF